VIKHVADGRNNMRVKQLCVQEQHGLEDGQAGGCRS